MTVVGPFGSVFPYMYLSATADEYEHGSWEEEEQKQKEWSGDRRLRARGELRGRDSLRLEKKTA